MSQQTVEQAVGSVAPSVARGDGRTVLFITVNGPQDAERHVHGPYLRQRLFAQAIARNGFDLHCVFYDDFAPGERGPRTEAMRSSLRRQWGIDPRVELCLSPRLTPREARSYWRHYVAPIFSPGNGPEFDDATHGDSLRLLTSCVARRPAAIFVMGLEPMLALDRLDLPLPPVYYDTMDIEYVKFARTLRNKRKRKGTWLRYLQMPALMRAEARAVLTSRTAFVCSEVDGGWVARLTRGKGNVLTIPNAVDVPDLPPTRLPGHTILFLGFLGYQPNRDAVEWLCREIWPLVRSAVPDARLLIAGDKAESIDAYHRPPPGVTFTGFVPDLSRIYAEADIFCCPILVGSGTRIKLVEAAMYAKPIVSTSVGAEGLHFVDGIHALMRDDAASFARACVDLLLDPDRARLLGAAARAFAAERYSRPRIVEAIAEAINP